MSNDVVPDCTAPTAVVDARPTSELNAYSKAGSMFAHRRSPTSPSRPMEERRDLVDMDHRATRASHCKIYLHHPIWLATLWCGSQKYTDRPPSTHTLTRNPTKSASRRLR